ncbi:unnamed protein product [Merluccius merluccius]
MSANVFGRKNKLGEALALTANTASHDAKKLRLSSLPLPAPPPSPLPVSRLPFRCLGPNTEPGLESGLGGGWVAVADGAGAHGVEHSCTAGRSPQHIPGRNSCSQPASLA